MPLNIHRQCRLLYPGIFQICMLWLIPAKISIKEVAYSSPSSSILNAKVFTHNSKGMRIAYLSGAADFAWVFQLRSPVVAAGHRDFGDDAKNPGIYCIRYLINSYEYIVTLTAPC